MLVGAELVELLLQVGEPTETGAWAMRTRTGTALMKSPTIASMRASGRRAAGCGAAEEHVALSRVAPEDDGPRRVKDRAQRDAKASASSPSSADSSRRELAGDCAHVVVGAARGIEQRRLLEPRERPLVEGFRLRWRLGREPVDEGAVARRRLQPQRRALREVRVERKQVAAQQRQRPSVASRRGASSRRGGSRPRRGRVRRASADTCAGRTRACGWPPSRRRAARRARSRERPTNRGARARSAHDDAPPARARGRPPTRGSYEGPRAGRRALETSAPARPRRVPARATKDSCGTYGSSPGSRR